MPQHHPRPWRRPGCQAADGSWQLKNCRQGTRSLCGTLQALTHSLTSHRPASTSIGPPSGYVIDSARARKCAPRLPRSEDPLASGYIWLLALWLLLHNRIRDARDHPGPLAELYETSQFLGQSVWLGAVSFLAFLIGSLLQIRIVRDGGRSVAMVVAAISHSRVPADQIGHRPMTARRYVARRTTPRLVTQACDASGGGFLTIDNCTIYIGSLKRSLKLGLARRTPLTARVAKSERISCSYFPNTSAVKPGERGVLQRSSRLLASLQSRRCIASILRRFPSSSSQSRSGCRRRTGIYGIPTTAIAPRSNSATQLALRLRSCLW